jgi:uncharacterized protein
VERPLIGRRIPAAVTAAIVVACVGALSAVYAQSRDGNLPELTGPVNDFAHIIDPESAAAIDRMSRALQAASGDVVVVATVPTIEPYGTIEEYAVKLFENHGRGIGDKAKDNGLLIVLAMRERKVRIETGYALEEFITDGFAGETIRQHMAPEFRNGRFGAGLRAGTARIVSRISQARGVTLEGVPLQRERATSGGMPFPVVLFILIVVAALILGRIGGGPRRGIRRWGAGPWSGWSSGVGPFGGGWGGGSGGGGFGGGFGGFGGGGSGGGGASGSW